MATARELITHLRRCAEAEQLHHAYLFYGEHRQAQEEVAHDLAYFLEKGEGAAAQGVLSDALVIDGKAQEAGIDAVRQAIDFVYRHPVLSGHRTLVFANAGELTEPAQNALLKVVEDPPEHALIILLLRDPSLLMPALVSRLQAIYVGAGSTTRSSDGEARAIAMRFLKASRAERSELIKELVEHDSDEKTDKSARIIDVVVEELIIEVAKRPEAHHIVLKELLKRQTAMADYSTNRRLQLEAIAQLLA